MTEPTLPIALYGTPPADLVEIDKGAVQLSPLLPGSEALDAQAEATFSSLVMLAPPGTIERRYGLALGLRALVPGGAFTIMAPKDKGGLRLKKELAAFGCEAEETVKAHHRICTGTRPKMLLDLDHAIMLGELQMVEAIGLWSQPGAFSWDRLDPGSTLLLDHLPAFAGKGADLGCGLGYLSAVVLASPKVTELTLIDIDRRAVEAARRNIDDSRATFLWGDVRSVPLDGLDFVVMNPPFHDAGKESRHLGPNFIKAAAKALKRGGVCWLIANRHLPYEDVLKVEFASVTQIVQSNGYKVYEARK